MDKRRELTLQRLSRIGGLAAAENAAQTEIPVSFKGKPVGAPSMEAVLAAYMPEKKSVFPLRTRQEKNVSTAAEQEQKQPQPLSFDSLDANRCAGFLLYSYDKNGIHSVLGENRNYNYNNCGGYAAVSSFVGTA